MFNTQDLLNPDSLTKATYQAFQEAKSAFSIAHKTISSNIGNLVVNRQEKPTPLSQETIFKMRQRQQDLLEIDWQDAQEGVYPQSLLFDNPWDDFFREYPNVWLDLPQIWQKVNERAYQKFRSEIDQNGYPSYYLQNFHFQTDGYLTDESANLYDLQVDLLFNGGTDAMRRRILKPLKQGLTGFDTNYLKILDVACGTGRTLKMIRAALPKASLFGIDLSPAYLRKANQLLCESSGELPQLIQANAEELPYQDNYFHGLTNVFMFHELPPEVRQKVITESYRVLKPGGVMVIADSIQLEDHQEFQDMLNNFPITFHEPYYKSYINDDLTERLNKAGFEVKEIQTHFASKYWIATKMI
jgi:ubiquinone/menaquinone biosynthesis C-methylase UbiE